MQFAFYRHLKLWEMNYIVGETKRAIYVLILQKHFCLDLLYLQQSTQYYFYEHTIAFL